MSFFEEIIRNQAFIFSLLIINTLLMIIFLICTLVVGRSYKNLNARYLDFMSKLGNGENVEKILSEYLKIVDEMMKKSKNHEEEIIRLENNLKKCVQKVGIVRYNAYGDTGSDLSFTLAMLNEKNDGVVLNGIYARDMSNIYAKPIEGGKSRYTLSEEEKEAIEKAVNN